MDDVGDAGDGEERRRSGSPLNPANVAAQLDAVGARSDQERITVMAQLAVDGGSDGIDYETLNNLYGELGLKKPAQFPTKTLSNAKYAGLMKMVSQGIWRPTYIGENFAKGHGRGGSAAPRKARRKASSNNEGGESD